MEITIKSKYNPGDNVRILGNTMKSIECTVKEVYGRFDKNGDEIHIFYVLECDETGDIDTRPEDRVFAD